MKKGVDIACYDLADHFLVGLEVSHPLSIADVERNRTNLAERIQEAVEDFMREIEADDGD